MNELHAGLAEIFEVAPDSVRAETTLAELGWDSLAMVSTIALLDELYGKAVGVAELKACATVGDLEALAV